MLKVKCNICHEEVLTSMYISDPKINTIHDAIHNTTTYIAQARGRAICPNCGVTIEKLFECDIYPSDVIDLALRREIQI